MNKQVLRLGLGLIIGLGVFSCLHFMGVEYTKLALGLGRGACHSAWVYMHMKLGSIWGGGRMIFIPSNVPSLKNSKVKTSKGIFPSKTVTKYIRGLGIQSYNSRKKEVKGYTGDPTT